MSIITIPAAWVNEIKEFDWGYAVKIAEDQRAKNAETGQWETVEKTKFDLTVPREIGFDFKVGDRITVVGKFRTKKWEKGENLLVRAQSVERFESHAKTVEEDLPF